MPIRPSPAVLRACDVLEHLAAHPTEAFSVSELAREVGMPRATCDAVLLALAERALVDRREPDLRYTLGPACIAVGDAARAAGSMLARVAPLVDALARETGTCAAIASHDGTDLRVEQVFDHGPAFGARAVVGESVPLTAPFGAVFVAWAPAPTVQRWLDGPALSDDERRRYHTALAAIRERGYSIAVANLRPELSEILERLVRQPGTAETIRERDAAIRELSHSEYLPVTLDASVPQRVNQMSAPVFDRAGRVDLAIMVLGPSYDLTPTEIDALGTRLLATARAATERVGGVAPTDAR